MRNLYHLHLGMEMCVFYANGYENLKHLNPQRDLLSLKLIEQYAQAAINLVLRGVLHQEK
jgi:hypothetical protein